MPSTKTPRQGGATIYPYNFMRSDPATDPRNARARAAYGDEGVRQGAKTFGSSLPKATLTKPQKYR